MHDDALIPTGEIHPAAALFPMLPEDELQELAEDIKANGLLHEIVLDADGVLIDGRNRLAACRLAGVAPRFAALNGHDPVAYILSSNVARRHMSKGQRAMAAVMAVSLSDTAITRERRTELARLADAGETLVAQAVMVRDHAGELAEAVIAGAVPLRDAYAEAKQRKEAQRSREEQAKRAETDLARLRAGAPDLAELVIEERMPLREALAAWRQREEERAKARRDLTNDCGWALAKLWAVLVEGPERIVERWEPAANGARANGSAVAHLWTGDGLRELARQVEAMAAATDRRGGLQ